MPCKTQICHWRHLAVCDTLMADGHASAAVKTTGLMNLNKDEIHIPSSDINGVMTRCNCVV